MSPQSPQVSAVSSWFIMYMLSCKWAQAVSIEMNHAEHWQIVQFANNQIVVNGILPACYECVCLAKQDS